MTRESFIGHAALGIVVVSGAGMLWCLAAAAFLDVDVYEFLYSAWLFGALACAVPFTYRTARRLAR